MEEVLKKMSNPNPFAPSVAHPPFAPSEDRPSYNPNARRLVLPKTNAPAFVLDAYFRRRYGHPIIQPNVMRRKYVAAAIRPLIQRTTLDSTIIPSNHVHFSVANSPAGDGKLSEKKELDERKLTLAAAATPLPPLTALSSAAAEMPGQPQNLRAPRASDTQRRERIEYFARICTGRATPLDLEKLVTTITQSSKEKLLKLSESLHPDRFAQLLTDVAELHELEIFNKEQRLQLEKQIYKKISRRVFAGRRIDWCQDREMNNLLVIHNPAFLSISFGVTSFGVANQGTLPWGNINFLGQPYFLAGSVAFSFAGQMIGTAILISSTEEINPDAIQEGPPRRVLGCYNTQCCYVPCSSEIDTAAPRRILSALINSFGVVLKLNVKIVIDFYCIKSLYPNHFEINAEGKEECHDSDDLGFALKFILPAAAVSAGIAGWFFYSPTTKRRWALQSDRNWVDTIENVLNWLWASGVIYAFGDTLYGMIARNVAVNPLPNFALEVPALALGIPLAAAIAPRYKESAKHPYRPVRDNENSANSANSANSVLNTPEVRSRNNSNRRVGGCGLKRNEIFMFILQDIMTLTYLSTLALSIVDIYKGNDDNAKYWAKFTLYGYGFNFLAGNIFSFWSARENIAEYRVEELRVKEQEWICDETDRIRKELKRELRPIIEKSLRTQMGLLDNRAGGSVDSSQASSPAPTRPASGNERNAGAAQTDMKTADVPVEIPLRQPAPQPEPVPRTTAEKERQEAKRVREEWCKKKKLELTFWVTKELEIDIREQLEREIRLRDFNRSRVRATSHSMNSPSVGQLSIPLIPQFQRAQAHALAQSPVSSPSLPDPSDTRPENATAVAFTSATATAIAAAGVSVVVQTDPAVRPNLRPGPMHPPTNIDDDDEDFLSPLEEPEPQSNLDAGDSKRASPTPSMLHAYRGQHPAALAGSAGSIRTVGRNDEDREWAATRRNAALIIKNARANIEDAEEHADSPPAPGARSSLCATICGWFGCR